jgi:hypothetical protein
VAGPDNRTLLPQTGVGDDESAAGPGTVFAVLPQPSVITSAAVKTPLNTTVPPTARPVGRRALMIDQNLNLAIRPFIRNTSASAV